MSWKVTVEVDSNLMPAELITMMKMFPGINDAIIINAELLGTSLKNTEES